MDKIFEKDYFLRTLDFDKFMNLKPSSVLDLFQDVAGYHTRQVSRDRFSMEKDHLYWVLVSVKVGFENNFDPFKHVTVRTWPIKSNGVRYYRNFLLLSDEGSVIAKAQSCWAVVDALTKHIAVNVLTFPEGYEYCEEETFDGKLTRLGDFEAEKTLMIFKPEYTDIDYNGHVNNAKYADFILNALDHSENKKIKTFQIDFHKEIKQEDEITLLSRAEGDCLKLKGVDGGGAVRFVSEITYE